MAVRVADWYVTLPGTDPRLPETRTDSEFTVELSTGSLKVTATFVVSDAVNDRPLGTTESTTGGVESKVMVSDTGEETLPAPSLNQAYSFFSPSPDGTVNGMVLVNSFVAGISIQPVWERAGVF